MTKQEYLEITNQLLKEEKEVREKTENLLNLKRELERNIRGMANKRSLLIQYFHEFDEVADIEEQKKVSEALAELNRLDFEARQYLREGVNLCSDYWG